MSAHDVNGREPQLSRRDLLQKGTLGAAALGVSGALFGGIAQRASAAPALSRATLRQVDLSISLGLDTAPLWAGMDKGFYGAHGIEVKPHTYFTGVQHVNSLASGESQVAAIGTAVLYSSVLNGVPLKIIGIMHGSAVARTYATTYIIAGRNSGIGANEVAKLRGKRIGTPLGTDGEAAALKWLATVNLEKSDVRLVNVAPPDLATALQTGAVDAISCFEPWPTLVLQRVPGSVRVTGKPPYFSAGVLVSTESAIQSRRKDLVDFLAGTAQAQQWSRKNLTRELIDINTRHTTVPAEVAKSAVNRIRFDGRISKLTLNRLAYGVIPTLMSIGVLRGGVDSRKAIDPSLNKEVQRRFPQYFSDLPKIPAQNRL